MPLKHLPRTAVALAAASMVVALASCSGDDDNDAATTASTGVRTTAVTSDASDAPETSGTHRSSDAATSTDRARSESDLPEPFSGALDGISGAYQYALVDITGDGADELLLRQESAGVGTISIFTSDGTAVPTTLQDGTSGPEGGAYSVTVTTDHNGLLTTDTPDGLGFTTTVRWELSGQYLQRTSDEWTYIDGLVPSDLAELQAPINWIDAVAGEPTPDSGADDAADDAQGAVEPAGATASSDDL